MHTLGSMPTKPSKPEPARMGRPPVPDPMDQRSMVRYTRADAEVFAAEVARLTRLTGQRWTVAGYLRVAGLAYIGKHLAGAE